MNCKSNMKMRRRISKKIYKKKSKKNRKKSVRNIKKKPIKYNKSKRRTRKYKQKGGFANLKDAFAEPKMFDNDIAAITNHRDGFGFSFKNVDTNGCFRRGRHPITKYNSCGNTDY